MSTAVTLTLVTACLHGSAKKCLSIWSHTRHYTHILKLLEYFLWVGSCRQIWNKSSENTLQRTCWTHRNWHFPSHLPVKCLFCFLIHSPTSTNICIDILPKSYPTKSLTGRREGNITITHAFQILVVSSKKFWPREVLTSSQTFKWHDYFSIIHLCHRRLSIIEEIMWLVGPTSLSKQSWDCVTDLLVCRLKVHFWVHISNLKKILWNGICRWVSKSCLTLCDLMNCSPPGFSVYRISQARTLNGLLFPTPGGLPNPRIRLSLLHWQGDSLLLRHPGSPVKWD